MPRGPALLRASVPPTSALGWVTSEGLAVDEAGEVHDLTIRSFGILRAKDMPRVVVESTSTIAARR